MREEVGVTITPGEYNLLTRKRAVLARKAGPLACWAGRRTYLLAELGRLTTELAFKKHQVRARSGSESDNEMIARLRKQIAELRQAALALKPGL